MSIVHQGRLGAILGAANKCNDVLFCTTSTKPTNQHLLIFGGDVQDFEENMMAHRDNKRYVKWSLESTVLNIAKRFPAYVVWMVRPSYMHLKTFSSYRNFVTSTNLGIPTYTTDGSDTWQHLMMLFKNAVEQSNVNESLGGVSDEEQKLRIVGFSKGCVVLNQLIHELSFILQSENEELKQFVRQVEDFTWLDGGHNGGHGSWLTDAKLLQKGLKEANIHVSIHVTPYQIGDSRRKWIGKEYKQFIKNLKDLKIDFNNIYHYEGEDVQLEQHFSLLDIF